MARPVLEELQKVKQLNMNGQTEERFERWRLEWDDIVSVQLPNLEEYLFDTEELIDKYRFRKVKAVQSQIQQVLKETDEKITRILSELNELVGSEEKNRTEIEELKESYRECKKKLLAHQHLFGKSVKFLEQRIDNVTDMFFQYDEKTEAGNYLDAREVVLSIENILDRLMQDMELIPDFLLECTSAIPSQLATLKEGHKEMIEQGYLLDHIDVENEVEKINENLAICLSQVEKAEIDGVSEQITDWKSRIDHIYEQLESEALAKVNIGESDREILDMLQAAHAANQGLKEELSQIQLSYHLDESDLKTGSEMDLRINELVKRFELIDHKIENHSDSFSNIQEDLLKVKDLLQKIMDEQSLFLLKLQALRKDELMAREKVTELRKKISESIRLISKSNIPGVPLEYKYIMEDAEDSVQNVMEKLEETPLNIPVVQQYLELAILTVDKVHNSTNEIIETSMLVEKVIQYGNRYRSRYPSVQSGLDEAEQYFRSYNYKEALEQAAATLEKVDPDVIKKIESLL